MKPLPARRNPIKFRHFKFIRKVFFGMMSSTVAIGAIGEYYDWWLWLKPYPRDSLEGIGFNEAQEDKKAYKAIRGTKYLAFEKNTEALAAGDEAKVRWQFELEKKDLAKAVEERASNKSIVFTKAPTDSVEIEKEVPK